MSVEILNFMKKIQFGIKGLQNSVLHHCTRHQKGSSDDLESLLKLAQFAEKLHASLAGVTPNQHHNRGNLIKSFTAEEDLNANEAVYISAANTVSKANNTNATKAIGVTIEAVSSGEPVDVCIAGEATAIANEAISVGDILTPSAVEGRLAILTTNTNSTGSHTHTQGATDSGGSHVHAQGVTGSGGSHSHSQGATGSSGNHYHTQGNTGSKGNHYHTQGSTGSGGTGQTSKTVHYHAATTESHDIPHSHDIRIYYSESAYDNIVANVAAKKFYWSRAEQMDIPTLSTSIPHTHQFYIDATGGHTHTGPSHTHSNPNTNTTGSHAHSNPNTSTTGSHTHTNPSTSEVASHTHSNPNTQSGGSHTHTNPSTNSAGSHSHTTNIGKVLAKAITAAASPGDTFTIIVCLGA